MARKLTIYVMVPVIDHDDKFVPAEISWAVSKVLNKHLQHELSNRTRPISIGMVDADDFIIDGDGVMKAGPLV